MYHVYKNGYSTLPNLRKINEEDVFEKSLDDSADIQKEKQEALKEQNFLYEYNNKKIFYEKSALFILKNYKKNIKSLNYLDIAKEIDEDLIIHRIDSENDYMCSAHVVFPSGWDPKNKIGRSFEEIHSPVPMNLKNSKKMVQAITKGIYERFVWSIVHEKKYNFHPRKNKKEFDPKNPSVIIKVERQVSVGFPEEKFCLFILRQYLIEEKQIDKVALSKAIRNMTIEQLKYKEIDNCYEKIIDYLNNI